MVSTNAIRVMKSMASDPRKRAALMMDKTCIGGLIMVLSNKDYAVVQLAIETLTLLAEGPEHRLALKNFVGLVDQLEAILSKRKADATVLQLTEALHLSLMDVDTSATPLRDTKNYSVNQSINQSLNVTKQKRTYKARNITLQIRGMIDKSDRDVCMKLLLPIKGVISITFDMHKKRCVARTKLDVKPETLVQALSKSQTMIAQQVLRNENGDETLVSFGNNLDDMEKENEAAGDLPDYLPDDVPSPVVDDKAVARVGKPDPKQGGWLSNAANFISSSFYW